MKADAKDFGMLPASAATSFVGHWSGNHILVNTKDLPIWTGGTDPTVIPPLVTAAAEQSFDRYLHAFGLRIMGLLGKGRVSKAIGEVCKGYGLRSSALADWANSVSPPNHGRYAKFEYALNRLRTEVGSDQLAAQKIADLYQESVNSNGFVAVLNREFGARIDSPSAMIRIDWDSWLSGQSVAQIVTNMLTIARYRENGDPTLKSRAEAMFADIGRVCMTVPVTNELFRVSEENSPNSNWANIVGLRSASRWALTTMIREGWLLLPYTDHPVNFSEDLFSAPWFGELGAYMPPDATWTRRLFPRIVCSTSVRSPADLSVPLCLLFNPSSVGSTGGSMIKGFTMAIQRYHRDHPDLSPFPVGEINNRRKLHEKPDSDTVGSPELLRAAGFDDWAVAVEVFYRISQLRRGGRRAAVKPILDWAIKYGHRSPWTLTTKQLINPLAPDDKTTYHAFLSLSPSLMTRRTGWGAAVRLFKVVFNALKPLPEYDTLITNNPFHGLSTPFKQGKPKTPFGKTFRRLIPANLLEAMLETLLDCDETGEPQYTWVKARYPVDTAERFNSRTSEYELVWHPARARCMAILLLIPLRGKQARWLDQGLLDNFKWDCSTGAWAENTHALRDFKYANGQNHADLYGRPSGVIQPLDSLLGGNANHIGLFINTNKTQLWNPEQRGGYSIPWPDGNELLGSDDLRIVAQGKRLGLVYKLIGDQIKWMETYDPSPIPVNFADDDEDFGPETVKALPVFCPIFRDLTSPATRDSSVPVHVPLSKQKLEALFHALAAETEDRLVAKGYEKSAIGLTVQKRNLDGLIKLGRSEMLRRCVYDIHSLRVAGITHLLEMGVPAHIVSEFIAGHMALVMTLHYAKFQPLKLRQKILDCYNEADSIRQFEEALGHNDLASPGLLIKNERFAADMRCDPVEFFQVKGTWRYINGGICPGASCSEGGVKTVEDSKSPKQVETEVPGGPESCGNCRFFMTSPAFLVPQMLTANSIMLQLRELGRQRKRLWDNRASLEISVFERTATPREKIELTAIESDLERIDRKLEPLILEWYNRYELFQQSLKLLDDWRGLNQGETGGTRLQLFGSDDANSLTANLDPSGSEYTLVKEIVAQSEILGGHRSANALADYKLREFVDRLLTQEKVTDLLLTVSDPAQQRTASLLLAQALEILAGGVPAINSALEGAQPLHLDHHSNSVLRSLAARLVTPNQSLQLGLESANLDDLLHQTLQGV